jgi:N4-gp56 family major capsid protein
MALDNFIPEIWSSQLLVNLKNELVFGNPLIANRNYTGDISAYGDTVHINSIGAVTVTDYSKNSDHATPETLSDSQMTLVIDQAKMFNFQIDDIDQAQQNPQLMSAAMGEAAFALANTADSFLSALVNSGVPGASAGNGNWLANVDASGTNADKLYIALVDLAVKLDENNCPTTGRWAVVRPAVYGVLLKDPRFVSFGTGDNRSVISNRAVGTVAGFTILVSNTVPNGASNPLVLAGHNSATTFAEQITSLKAYEPERRFADALKGLHVYGGKVIRPELLAKVEVDVTA